MNLTPQDTPRPPGGLRHVLRIVLRWLAAYLASLLLGLPFMALMIGVVDKAPSLAVDPNAGGGEILIFALVVLAAAVLFSFAPAIIVTSLALRGPDRSHLRAVLGGAATCVAAAVIATITQREPWLDYLLTPQTIVTLLAVAPAGAVSGLVFRWVWLNLPGAPPGGGEREPQDAPGTA